MRDRRDQSRELRCGRAAREGRPPGRSRIPPGPLRSSRAVGEKARGENAARRSDEAIGIGIPGKRFSGRHIRRPRRTRQHVLLAGEILREPRIDVAVDTEPAIVRRHPFRSTVHRARGENGPRAVRDECKTVPASAVPRRHRSFRGLARACRQHERTVETLSSSGMNHSGPEGPRIRRSDPLSTSTAFASCTSRTQSGNTS